MENSFFHDKFNKKTLINRKKQFNVVKKYIRPVQSDYKRK